MIKRTLGVAAVLVFLSGSAFAFHCPTDVKAIDAALAKQPALSAEQLSEVKKLRDEGDRLHRTGRHGTSLDALHKVMEILRIKQILRIKH